MHTDPAPLAVRPSALAARAARDVPPSAAGSARAGRGPRPCELVEVMARVQGGDQDAFRDLYDLTAGPAHARALRTTWSTEHAAEVVQEVYLHVWTHAADYTPSRGSVLGWLLTLVHRRAVDRVRNVTSAVRRDQQDFQRSDATSPDVADLGVARHEARRLREAVGRLSSKQRDALTLTYLQGYTTLEAAALLQIPVGTVKTRVRDGIAALRDQLTARVA